MAQSDDDSKIGITIKGREYEIDVMDLEFQEIEALEDACDAPLEAIDFRRARALRALAYLVLHREDPSVSMDDVRKMKMSDLSDADAEKPAPPTRAKRSAAS